MNIFTKEVEFADGRVLTIETGKLAKQADGSAVLKYGDTMLLATVVSAREARADVDFMPLSVDYREKFAAAGRIPGSFTRREGRPSDSEILVSRLIDRVLRPLFPSDYHADTFVNIELISADRNGEVMPDAFAGLAASAALALSDIPFGGPISEVRVARIDGSFVINPTYSELEKTELDIMVGATIDNIMMVEGEMKEVSESIMLEALEFAHNVIKIQCQAQIELAEEVGTTIKREYKHEDNDEALKDIIELKVSDKIYEIVKSSLNKHDRREELSKIQTELIEDLDLEEVNETLVKKYFHDIEKNVVRKAMLNDRIRLDGRQSDEIRDIWSEVNYLPGAHGSALFTRGETQALATVTLGSPRDEKLIDNVMIQGKSKFMLHYNFPPFSTNDARPQRGVGRREIGHGNLAYRAIMPMLPLREDNPYTIRIVSDILESNGSSSMATVCAGTMALMDAGIKIIKPVSGIAMGLITDGAENYVILSDILGDEDHLGDMDFKVTGTRDGITACQMDIKVDGLPYEILAKALYQAKNGRLHILDKMNETITEPRIEYKKHTPGIKKIIIPKELIGAVIGPGGKTIQEIQAVSGTEISIDENNGFGEVIILGPNQEALNIAIKRVKNLTILPEVGEIYTGKIKSIVSFGAFVEIMPGKEGLLHISEIEHRRLDKVEEVLKEGELVKVKLIGFDKKSGKIKLSRKALMERPRRRYERRN